ncbi:MAG: Formamidopyrimidine-DNA glycosylase [Candidatus Marinimicrobia bacterium]|nr:Formamidopyrimidine-DNA glycosylase [Candidatus Neomarinimicrobiota bacterium]
MPELPDVEVFRRYFDSTALHQEITAVEVRETRLLDGIDTRQLNHLLRDKEFTGTERHGKYLFAQVASHGWLVLHFGMTGFLKYYKQSEEEPPYPRLLFEFSNGYRLAYDNMRMLGKVAYIDTIDDYVAKQDLGPDALKLSEEDFIALIPEKRGMIKSALMDQSFIAGLGNIYVDEILFHTGIHPRRQVSDLSDIELQTMYDTMHEVLGTAIELEIVISEFPGDYLIHYRDEDAECPKCGSPIRKIKVASRSTYFCERCQPIKESGE